jgi:hypothetical protein
MTTISPIRPTSPETNLTRCPSSSTLLFEMDDITKSPTPPPAPASAIPPHMQSTIQSCDSVHPLKQDWYQPPLKPLVHLAPPIRDYLSDSE